MISALIDKLHQHKQAGLLRKRKAIGPRQGANIVFEGKLSINFCSNDYLGLAQHPLVIDAYKKGIDTYGVGSSASMMVSGYYGSHHNLENAFCDFFERERALLFSSGYLANLGLISAITKKNNLVLADKLIHASLIDGCQLAGVKLQRYRHNNYDDLQRRLIDTTTQPQLLITDSVFSMEGDCIDSSKLLNLSHQYDIPLLVDDAHGVGVIGNEGQGIVGLCDNPCADITFLVTPFGKALGGMGAVVTGDKDAMEVLLQFSRTSMYSTALPPAMACAMLQSLKLLRKDSWRREKLIELITYFKEKVSTTSFSVLPSDTAIQSIIIGDPEDTMKVVSLLNERGLFVSGIRPPTVPFGTSRLRITLSCLHEKKDINHLVDSLEQVYEPIR